MKIIAILAVRFYQKHLRHRHNRRCIYTPSCSNYTIAAIEKYGVIKGCRYGYLRIKRCNGALYKGGEDLP
ncbi:membrane protein insertion efficiency factor YidD [Aeromonas veronii]|uniref:membrane protein insertion efficiency factor YidD n=1 Tax=Aeromonas veronii TaxID=654 RepID=UPI00111A35EA|nr:membrane protein insertion efficiency factor YidD [Aeromonas veronii]